MEPYGTQKAQKNCKRAISVFQTDTRTCRAAFSQLKPLPFLFDKLIILTDLDTEYRQDTKEKDKKAITLSRLEIPSNNRHGSYQRG